MNWIDLSKASGGISGKRCGDFLRRSVLDSSRRELPPALDPAAAEMAIAVEDEERLGRRVADGDVRRRGSLTSNDAIVRR